MTPTRSIFTGSSLLVLVLAAGCAGSRTSAPAEPRPRADAPADGAGAAATAPAEPPMLEPVEGLRVRPSGRVVEIDALVCEPSWLEQVACAPRTREHESLVVIAIPPSEIHAAMLLAGFESGAPGGWDYVNGEDGEYRFRPPTGDSVEIFMRYRNDDGELITEPARRWIRDSMRRQSFPNEPWIFAGSEFAPNPPGMPPGEHYVADHTGSILGLATFGDEVIAFALELADGSPEQAEWVMDEQRAPKPGTPVTVVVRAWE